MHASVMKHVAYLEAKRTADGGGCPAVIAI